MNTFAASALKTAIKQSNKTTTTNGAKAFVSTLNANLDLFGKSGEIKYPNFLADFQSAFNEDQQLALRNLLNTRDIRGGKGVRNTFKTGLLWLAEVHPSIILQSNILNVTGEVGCWKDLFVLVESPIVGLSVKQKVISVLAHGLADPDKQGLVAKWLPLKGPVASMLRSYLRLPPKEFRKKIVALRANVTERAMCEKRWAGITYQHVPSRCMYFNRNAFQRNDTDRFNKFIESVNKGETTLHASTLYPHEISMAYKPLTEVGYSYLNNADEDAVAEAQWKSLPNYLEGKKNAILPVVDLSGSMNATSGKYSYAHIAVTLGAYISERTEGPFKDLVTTFADEPSFVSLQKCNSLRERLRAIAGGRIGYSTNVEGTFKLVLDLALKYKIAQEDMPEALLFLSDTQANFTNNDRTIYKTCKKMFKEAGYEAPKLLFWVLNAASNNNVPVKFDTDGAALVSGFSPSMLKPLLSDLEQYTPMNVMLEALNDPRYTVKFYS